MASISRLLQPAILEADPSKERSAKIYKHWVRTFESFFSAGQSAVLQSVHEDDDGDDSTLDKPALLSNHISPGVYFYVEDCNSYDATRKELDRVYLKKDLNDVYARHRLLTRKQKPAEDVAQFNHAIKDLSKDCVCNAVTAEEFRADLARDAVITGLDSSTIRQRLLEEDTLSFQSAVTKTLVLERAQKRASSFTFPMLNRPLLLATRQARLVISAVAKSILARNVPLETRTALIVANEDIFRFVSPNPKLEHRKNSFRLEQIELIS